jgi:hypothetical protein
MANLRFAKTRLVRRLEDIADTIGTARGFYWEEARSTWSPERATKLEDREAYLGDVQDDLFLLIYKLDNLPRLS